MSDVWMQVSSRSYGLADDQRITAAYYDNIDMITVEVGSGQLFMTLGKAAELAVELAAAIDTAADHAVSQQDSEAVA